MEERLNINISVEGIQLPLTVRSAEEEKWYRDASSMIKDRLQQLRTAFPQVPNDKYYYVMAMLNIAVEAVRTAENVDNSPFIEMIEDLNKELGKLKV